MAVNRDQVLAWIAALQTVYAENKEYLTQLDSAIGDADHGINMNRGFTTAKEDLDAKQPEALNDILKGVSMSLIRKVGGAAGPLYGTFFMRAAATVADKEELDSQDLVAMFEAGLQGILQRGKAEVGDKTMVDAWTPAVAAMKEAADEGADVAIVVSKGAAAAEQGMKDTIPLVARKGRASYLGERSKDHQDPGATSSYLMLQAAADTWG